MAAAVESTSMLLCAVRVALSWGSGQGSVHCFKHLGAVGEVVVDQDEDEAEEKTSWYGGKTSAAAKETAATAAVSDIDEWSDSEEWECLVCGYLNPPAAPACACGASKQEEANAHPTA